MDLNTILNSIFSVLYQMVQAIKFFTGAYAEGDIQLLSSYVVLSASSAGSCQITIPSDGDYVVQSLLCEPTSVNFTVNIKRSSSGGRGLTDGPVYSTFVLPKSSTLPGGRNQIIPPFLSKRNESFTFDLVDGSGSSNTVKIIMVARQVSKN